MKLERKSRDVPAEWFEHREFLDFLEKAYKGTGYCFALLVPMLRFLFKYGPYCVLMGLYLKRYDPVLGVVCRADLYSCFCVYGNQAGSHF